MAKSASNKPFRNFPFAAKGVEASRLRRRKYTLVRKFGLPEDILGGSLSQTHRCCGKAGCHCAEGDGHPMWVLTYSVDGVKYVQHLSGAWVDAIEPLVEEGRTWAEAVAEVRALNAQLLALGIKQHRKKNRD